MWLRLSLKSQYKQDWLSIPSFLDSSTQYTQQESIFLDYICVFIQALSFIWLTSPDIILSISLYAVIMAQHQFLIILSFVYVSFTIYLLVGGQLSYFYLCFIDKSVAEKQDWRSSFYTLIKIFNGILPSSARGLCKPTLIICLHIMLV